MGAIFPPRAGLYEPSSWSADARKEYMHTQLVLQSIKCVDRRHKHIPKNPLDGQACIVPLFLEKLIGSH